jgi:hypothetical protein
MRSGPVINTLFNDCPPKVAEESNTPRYGFFSGYGKSLIVGDTSIRLMDSTLVLVLCVLNPINLA